MEGNAVNDMTIGKDTAKGHVSVIAYCQSLSGFVSVFVKWTGYNLNRPTEHVQVGAYGSACDPVGTFRGFHVCQTALVPVAPALGHAERSVFTYTMAYASGFRGALSFGSRTFYVNDKGVFYPKVAIRPSWAVLSVYAAGAGYVKFPTSPLTFRTGVDEFRYCPDRSQSPYCHNKDRSKLKQNMLNPALGNLPAPPSGFQAHHIKPISWCGDNSIYNGVFLPQNVAEDSEEGDAGTHAQFTAWWNKDNFHPDDPVSYC